MQRIVLPALALLLSFCSFATFIIKARPAAAAAVMSSISIPATDPDFSIVLFPDTQYYNGANTYVFQDQAKWVVANKSALNIKMVVGLGDIVDGGGYPVDSAGNVIGSCVNAPPPQWQTQWQQAQSAVSILKSNGILFLPTIGNHDYDCETDRPQPRSASNYFRYFGPPFFQPTGYLLDSAGQRTPNFYQVEKIGSTSYLFLSLELFPRSFIVSRANQLIANFPGPVIVTTHAYLSNDGAGPTFGSTFPAGSAYPLCSGFPASIYGCRSDSLASYNPVGGGTDGIGLWYNLIGIHSNVLLALSGHVRNPSPGDYPNVPSYNGVGYVNCAVQSWSTLCSNPFRPLQMLSDFQGQGNGGYFGYGYLRILVVSPKTKTVSVHTYSPSISGRPGNFPAGIPAYKTDSHNQFTLNFPAAFGGPKAEVTHISSPRDGSHVAATFGIAAAATGPDIVNHLQIYVDGGRYADFAGASTLPAGTQIALSSSGTHRVAVQGYDTTKAIWVKSVIYVTTP